MKCSNYIYVRIFIYIYTYTLHDLYTKDCVWSSSTHPFFPQVIYITLKKFKFCVLSVVKKQKSSCQTFWGQHLPSQTSSVRATPSPRGFVLPARSAFVTNGMWSHLQLHRSLHQCMVESHMDAMCQTISTLKNVYTLLPKIMVWKW